MNKFYFFISGIITMAALLCLPFASNAQIGDNCANAVELPVNIGSCNNLVANNTGATDSGAGTPSCGAYAGGDIWFSFVIPPSGEVTVRAEQVSSNITDMAMSVYSGSCGSLTPVDCNDDGAAGFFPEITVTGQTSGETLYARIWELGNDEFGSFAVCAQGAANCDLPEANFTVNTDCENDQFSVDVELTSMGSASAIDLTNNAGVSATTGITSTGTYTVGPFSNSTSVIISVENQDDAECGIESDELSADSCPTNVTCGTDLNDTYCYGNNDDNVLTYLSDNGNALTLEFNSGIVEDCCDDITIFDGETTSDPVLYNGSGDLTGVSVTSTGGAISFAVNSDGSGSCQDDFVQETLDYTLSCMAQTSGGDCGDATTISVATTFAETQMNGDVQGASASGLSQCNGGSGAIDVFYSYTAATSTTFINAVGNGDFDPVLEIYADCQEAPLMCLDETGAGQEEFAIVNNQNPGQTYYYRIYHSGSSVPSNTTFTTATAHVPFVKLSDQSCGVMDYSTNDIIRSDYPSNLYLFEHYVFEFTELEAPFNTYEVVSPNSYNPNFLLSWFNHAEPGRTYEVRVHTTQYEGPTDGDYGATCVIGIEANQSTALAEQFAGGTFQFCDLLFAEPVGNADSYRFVFDDGTNTVEYTSNSYNVILNNASGLQYNTTYDVEVYATINGVESTTSTTRIISIGGVPQTGINEALTSCGSVVAPNAVLYAQNVCRASAYEWKFVNTTETQADILYTRSGGAYNIILSHVNGLIPGDTYDVQIRAIEGQQEGVFGGACSITIEGGNGVAPDGGNSGGTSVTASKSLGAGEQLALYPNPNDGSQVRVVLNQLQDKDQTFNVDIYDLSGKKVHSKQVANSGNQLNTVVTFDRELKSGLYMVNITWGSHEMTRRLMVQ